MSVDPPPAQAAMNGNWHLPFRWESDPGGSRFGHPLDAWNPAERDGLLVPLVLLVAPDGRVLVEHRSRDFADREDDEDVLLALRELDLPARATPAAWAPGVEPQPTDGAFRVEAFGPYFRGIRFNMKALEGRMHDERDAQELRATGAMAQSFLQAWSQRREAAEQL